jgi:hypothetical protein
VSFLSISLRARVASAKSELATQSHLHAPPGHWALLAQFVSARDHHTLDRDVKMFFALTNATFDASIVAWDAKRAFDSIRLASAICFLFHGQ